MMLNSNISNVNTSDIEKLNLLVIGEKEINTGKQILEDNCNILEHTKQIEESKELEITTSYLKEALKYLNINIQIQRPFKNKISNNAFYSWTNQWNNLHNHYNALVIEEEFIKLIFINRLLTNRIYIKISQNDLKIIVNSYGIFNEHKAKKTYDAYINKVKIGIFQSKLQKLASIYITFYNVKRVKILFYINYIAKNKLVQNVYQIFKKNKNDRYFKITIQLFYAVYKGQCNAVVLSQFIILCIKKNPSRTRFLTFLKQLINWYFLIFKKKLLKVTGVRVEVKGRFTAKSRARKQILSVGRIRIKEKTSPVVYKKDAAITKFGVLSIKVWICPL